MKPIGGFFELEIPNGKNDYHETPNVFSYGRNCLKVIIDYLKPSRIYIPFYICDTVVKTIQSAKTEYEFYPIDQNFNLDENIELLDNEYILYVNYFGIKKEEVNNLIRKYPHKLILDNTQAFFEKKLGDVWSFNSARKYFGVPDGAYLYSPQDINTDKFDHNEDFGFNYLINRITGKQNLAYNEFKDYEKSINKEIFKISNFSKILLSNIDYKAVADKRVSNFSFLHKLFRDKNRLMIPDNFDYIPNFYPLLLEKSIEKEEFYKKNIFVPTFWTDVVNRDDENEKFQLEKEISQRLIPLPIDQRLDREDMEYIGNEINQIILKA